MACPICDKKAQNCDCTATERAQHGLLEDALAEIDRLREERRWIPVGERLPEVGVDVLAIGDEGVFQARLGLWGESHRWKPLILECHGCGCCGGGKPSVTHWQPLPATPKGGEVGE